MASGRRIAFYGGSFDPPHLGHGMVAAWLRWSGLVDEVWLVPVFEHAFGKPLRSFVARQRACEALADLVGDWVRVSDVEAALGGVSFTRRTLDALAERHPEAIWRLVIGADLLPGVSRWRDWSVMSDRYDPIVVGRQGYPTVPGSPSFPAISSTRIREMLAEGAPVDHLVPPAVVACWSQGSGGGSATNPRTCPPGEAEPGGNVP